MKRGMGGVMACVWGASGRRSRRRRSRGPGCGCAGSSRNRRECIKVRPEHRGIRRRAVETDWPADVDPKARYAQDTQARTLADIVRDGDVVMCMGAGSIGGVPAKLVEMGGAA